MILWILLSAALAVGAAPEPQKHAGMLERGRQMDALVAAGDASQVFRRFDAAMARAVPEERLAQIFKSIRSQAKIGPRTSEAIVESTYSAVHRYGSGTIRINMSFDSSGAISGLFLKPELGPGGLPPDPRAGYRTNATLRLPFAGAWWIFWGGDRLEQNYHAAVRDQRHAYDIVMMKNGSTHRSDGTANEDYYAFGQRVLAPAGGTVVEAVDGIADNRPGVMNSVQIYGNHVVLDLGHNEFAVICHFKKGSLVVKAGSKVKAGEALGLCGNSGNSSEPHIHFHLQDGKELGTATGLPAPFTGYIADGKRVARGVPVRGQTVQNAP